MDIWDIETEKPKLLKNVMCQGYWEENFNTRVLDVCVHVFVFVPGEFVI